jgi:hypothetical protein
VSDDTHVADVCWVVHQAPELLGRKVDHGCKMETEKARADVLCLVLKISESHFVLETKERWWSSRGIYL